MKGIAMENINAYREVEIRDDVIRNIVLQRNHLKQFGAVILKKNGTKSLTHQDNTRDANRGILTVVPGKPGLEN